jgi:hypothetical protein
LVYLTFECFSFKTYYTRHLLKCPKAHFTQGIKAKVEPKSNNPIGITHSNESRRPYIKNQGKNKIKYFNPWLFNPLEPYLLAWGTNSQTMGPML